MRLQFSLADLLALITLVSVGLGLMPLWQSSLLAIGVSISLLLGSFVGSLIGFAYGRVRWTVLWGILSSLLGTLGWLLMYSDEWHSHNPSWPITFIIIALTFSVPSASVAAVFNRDHRAFLIWPSVNCLATVAILALLALLLWLGFATFAWTSGKTLGGPELREIATAVPLGVVFAVIGSIACGVTFGSFGLAIKGVFSFQKHYDETRGQRADEARANRSRPSE